jgi:hypothetical protein
MFLLTVLLLIVAVVELALRMRADAGPAPTCKSFCARLTAGRLDLSLSLSLTISREEHNRLTRRGGEDHASETSIAKGRPETRGDKSEERRG